MSGARLAAALIGAACLWAPDAFGAPSADSINRDLRAGRPVIEDGAILREKIDLTGLDRVRSVFVCRHCTFARGIDARHVVFERGTDLSGSRVIGGFDLHGARFKEAALFGPARGDEAGAMFDGEVDLAFAKFDGLAIFRGATFEQKADFTSAQFGSFARFGNAAFIGDALFEEAIFMRDAGFAHAGFLAAALFNGTAFGGVSDFRQANFTSATFDEAIFRGRAEFSEANVARAATFDDSRFAADALFVGTDFLWTADPAVSFDHAAIRGRLDFDAAQMKGAVYLVDASVGSFSLDGVEYGPKARLYIDGLGAADTFLELRDVDYIDGVPDERRRILDRAEATAKAEGDLGLANDLHYRLHELASNDYRWRRRALDYLFYRGVAGYFVRPLRPLFWLAILVVVAAAIRTLRRERQQPTPERPAHLARERVVGTGRRFVRMLVFTIRPRAEMEDHTPSLRRIELAAYGALLACFLLALANTNPTLRTMVDALV